MAAQRDPVVTKGLCERLGVPGPRCEDGPEPGRAAPAEQQKGSR